MGKQVQPGAKVNEETYKRFRQFVKDNHGKTRGSLGDELERAMEQRMEDANGPDRLARIENDLATLKAQFADAECDGGYAVPSRSQGESTHTREMSKPASNQPRVEKHKYIISRLFKDPRGESPNGGELAPKEIRNVILEEYNFDDSIVDEYVSDIQHRLGTEYGAEPHPVHGQTLIWGERLEATRDGVDE